MSVPKISVIVTFYNIAEYVDRCMSSIVNQTLQDIEIIAVNDGSNDNSLAHIYRYAASDSRVLVVDKPNGGVSSARNAGLKLAKGEYIVHVDGDDWIEEKYLETAYNKAKKLDLDIVVADFFFAYSNGDRVYKKDGFTNDNSTMSGKEYIEEYIANLYAPGIWNKMFARSLYYKNNIRYPLDIDLGEDLATAMRLYFFAVKVGKINIACYNYYQREHSLNRVKIADKQLYEIINVFMIIEDVYKSDLRMQSLLNCYKRWFFVDQYLFNQNMNTNGLIMREMIVDLLRINQQCPLIRKTYKLMVVSWVLKVMPYFYTVVALRFINRIIKRKL